MKLKQIQLDQIKENELNPRKLNNKEFNRLVNEFKRGEVKSAILVTPLDDGYQLIDGHHRLLAAQKTGLKSLPAIVVEDYAEQEQLADLIRMNKPVAEIDDVKMAKIIARLKELGWDYGKLERRLTYDEDTLVKYDTLLDFDFSQFKFEEQVNVENIERKNKFTVQVTPDQKEIIDQVLEKCISDNKEIKTREEALLLITQSFLDPK